MSKYSFLVTSAINTKFGVFDSAQRMAQTIATFDSIKQRVPDADIFLIEMGAIPLTDAQRSQLSPYVVSVVEFSNDPNVVSLYNSTDNWDIVKNVTEVMCFAQVLKNLVPNAEQFANTERIFKMSGRYTLNDKFDIDYYNQHKVKNNIVVGQRKNSQFGPVVTGGVSQQFMSRLWSWPKELTSEIITVYDNSLVFMGERIQSGGYADIEHTLFKFLDHDKVIEKDRLGIQGNIGPNGMAVED